MTRFASFLLVVMLLGCPPLQRFKCDQDSGVDCDEETGGGGGGSSSSGGNGNVGGGDGQGGGPNLGGGSAKGGGSTGGGTSGVGGFSGLGGGSTLAEQQKQYEDARTQLDRFKTHFRDKQYFGPKAVGEFVYFQSQDSALHLHRYSLATQMSIDYGFTLRGREAYFQASESMVVAPTPQAANIYEAFDANETNKSLGAVTLPFKDNSYVYPYGVLGQTLYVAMDELNEPTLKYWQPSIGLSTFVTLSAVTHTTLASVGNMAVRGDLVVFLAGTRLWKMSLSKKEGTLLKSSTIPNSLRTDGQTVAWRDDNGLFVWTASDTSPQPFSEFINLSGYKFNEEYKTIHKYDAGDFTLWKNWLIYICATHGVMAINLTTRQIRPVVLIDFNAAVRIAYRTPEVTPSGQLFLTALESASGSIGNDGPIVQVDLTTTLKE